MYRPKPEILGIFFMALGVLFTIFAIRNSLIFDCTMVHELMKEVCYEQQLQYGIPLIIGSGFFLILGVIGFAMGEVKTNNVTKETSGHGTESHNRHGVEK